MKRWMKILICVQMLLLVGFFTQNMARAAEDEITEEIAGVGCVPHVEADGNISIDVQWDLWVYPITQVKKKKKTTEFVIYCATADASGKWSAYRRIATVTEKESRNGRGWGVCYYHYVDKDNKKYGKYYRYRVVAYQGKKRMRGYEYRGCASVVLPEMKFLTPQLSVTPKAVGLHFVVVGSEWDWTPQMPKHRELDSIRCLMPEGVILYRSKDGKNYEQIYECPVSMNWNSNIAEAYYTDLDTPPGDNGTDYKLQTYAIVGGKKKLGKLSKPFHVNACNLPGQFDLELLVHESVENKPEEMRKPGEEGYHFLEFKLTSNKGNAPLYLNSKRTCDYIHGNCEHSLSFAYSYDRKNWSEWSDEKRKNETLEIKPGESIYFRFICGYFLTEELDDDIFDGMYRTVIYDNKKCILCLEPSAGQAYVYSFVDYDKDKYSFPEYVYY